MVKTSLFFMIAFTVSQALANMLVYGKVLNDSLNLHTFFMSIAYTCIVLLFDRYSG